MAGFEVSPCMATCISPLSVRNLKFFSTNALGCVQNDCVTASMKHIPTRKECKMKIVYTNTFTIHMHINSDGGGGANEQFVLFIPSSPSSLFFFITQTKQQRISEGKAQKRISEQGTFSSEAKQFEFLLP
uniref:Uncharacterized protein n=1 Tax=Glossina austeni TaxID=7395 RepID=A0A1A9VIF8_GLOAU